MEACIWITLFFYKFKIVHFNNNSNKENTKPPPPKDNEKEFKTSFNTEQHLIEKIKEKRCMQNKVKQSPPNLHGAGRPARLHADMNTK